MGNCGFTLAPCRESEADLVMRNLERAEDISRAAMKAGIKWRWETFPNSSTCSTRCPRASTTRAISATARLRTYVMGQRAFTDEATEDDLKAMVASHARRRSRPARTASRPRARVNHQTSDDKPVASRLATWDEFETLVQGDGRRAWSRSRASRAAPTATRRAPTTRA